MTCPVCRDPVPDQRSSQAKYCSDSCRWRAKDLRERRDPTSEHGHTWRVEVFYESRWWCANEGCEVEVSGRLSMDVALEPCEAESEQAA